MTFDLKQYFNEKKSLVDEHLKRYVPAKEQDPQKLHEAMHYSLFASGKRIRPILCLATAEALDLPLDDVLPLACSLEMIHVFSLIHDDLPAMDDDDLRRGQPTNHKVYGEALAILAGDNLLSHAFDPLTQLNQKKYAPSNIIQIIQQYALATGSQGMIAGQVIDIESEGKQIDLERLKKLHRHKTGALIRLAVEGPALLCQAPLQTLKNLQAYGENIGLAFQIADDILDIEGDASLGKDLGSDIEKGKATYPSLMGIEQAKQEAARVLEESLNCLKDFGEKADPLRHIARFVVARRT